MFCLDGAGITGYTERTSHGSAAGRLLSGSSGEVSRQGILWVCDRGKGGILWIGKTAAYFGGAWALAPWSGGVRVVCLCRTCRPCRPDRRAAALPPKGYLALTFDGAPGPRPRRPCWTAWPSGGVKATFFLVGEQVADHQDTVRRMADEGHQIGLHTWHHVSLQGMTREEIAAQLGKTQQTIQAVVGPEELMLRPPYGFVDETLKQWAKTPIVCWSVDTEDWKDQNVERIVQTVTQQAEDGDIILMHDIFETSVTAALACVDRLMAQGYYFVTVEELFALRGEVPQEGGVYLSLPPKT